jgi:hypothetical protein
MPSQTNPTLAVIEIEVVGHQQWEEIHHQSC